MSRTPLDVITYSFRDASDEPSAARVPLKVGVTAPQLDALQAALIAMSTNTLTQYSKAAEVQVSVAAGAGLRESKYLIRGLDTFNNLRVSLSIPGVRPGTVMEGPKSDFVDMVGDAQAAALKAALDVVWASQIFDHLVVVQSIEVTRGRK